MASMTVPASGLRELALASRAERRQAFEEGTRPEVSKLVGWEFRGWNTGWIAPLLRIRKFGKALFTAAGDAYGCNTPAEQNGLDEEWVAKPSEEAPKRFAFYAVDPTVDRRHPNAILLDYGRGRNGFFELARLLRDYVVRVSPESEDLLLGKAYLAIGPLRIPVTYFVLERRRPLPDQPRLPGD
jgi:hypothetical protein